MSKRPLSQEGYDRHGHWTREFSLRGEGWSVLEHWAGEYGFGLIHFKGNRRIYRKGDHPHWYVVYVEFRLNEEDNRLAISAWIEAGRAVRFMSLFNVHSVLDISPYGFWAIRTRRRTCFALNSLLHRMKQPSILGSEGLHWADLDASTLGLATAVVITAIFFLTAASSLVVIEPGLSNGLIRVLAKYSLILLGTLVAVSSVQQLIVVRKWPDGPSRSVSAILMYAIVFVTTLHLFTATRTETRNFKLAHYCLQRVDTNRCNAILDSLAPNDRRRLMERVFELEDALALRQPKEKQTDRSRQ